MVKEVEQNMVKITRLQHLFPHSPPPPLRGPTRSNLPKMTSKLL